VSIGFLERVAAWVLRRKKLKAFVFKIIPIRVLFRLKMVIKNQHEHTNFKEKNAFNDIQDPKLDNLIRLLGVKIK
jgi:hypothetical protein